MTRTARTHFKRLSWDEIVISEPDNSPKLAYANAAMEFTGDIIAETSCQGFILYYDTSGTGTFRGFEQLVGSIHGKSGSLVFETSGSFEADGIHASWIIVPGSATGDLTSITGTGSYTISWGTTETDASLDYDLPRPRHSERPPESALLMVADSSSLRCSTDPPAVRRMNTCDRTTRRDRP